MDYVNFRDRVYEICEIYKEISETEDSPRIMTEDECDALYGDLKDAMYKYNNNSFKLTDEQEEDINRKCQEFKRGLHG